MITRIRSHWTTAVKGSNVDNLFVCQHSSKPLLAVSARLNVPRFLLYIASKVFLRVV